MKRSFTTRRLRLFAGLALVSAVAGILMASSHREAPMIADDPTADNTDVYAFRSPTNANKVILVANYIPFQLPDAGPNYYHFAEDVRYEIHVDNNVNTKGDDIIYRFTFKRMNEDPTTFFSVRLGKENLKTTYTLQRSVDGGKSFQNIITNGKVPPPNIGPRSISSPVGLNAPDYNTLMKQSIMTASTGERVFAGQIEDPFFVDAGGIFDLGDAPRTSGGMPKDVLRCKNVHTLTLEVDIATLQKDKKPVAQATSILDPNYVIGVWASASRQKITVLNGNGTKSYEGDWVQVSRLGMPLTNEVIIPIGMKDRWNSVTPYEEAGLFDEYFFNPELALYMDDEQFGSAVPALKPLRIQKKSLGAFGFGNGQNGLYGLKGSAALNGTALAEGAFGSLLLPAAGKPRSVDLWPLFHTGVPNMRPYQLAVTKNENPLAPGKPFIHNFLPNGGDMLRLNMAVPTTPRNSADFSNLGLLGAAVQVGTNPKFMDGDISLEFIPNMDGFPNGRRLEDDVTRISLQAVAGVVLAAIGLPYDDYVPGSLEFFTPKALGVAGYNTGINKNDAALMAEFPFVQAPYAGNGPNVCNCDGNDQSATNEAARSASTGSAGIKLRAPEMMMSTQNPVAGVNTIRYHVAEAAQVRIVVYDAVGQPLKVLVNGKKDAGTYTVQWNTSGLTKGTYMISGSKNGVAAQTLKVMKQ